MGKTEPVRERIMDHAAELFLRRGFSRITTEELARAVGVSKKTIYLHFRSKEQLLRRVVEREMDRIRAHIQEISDQPNMSSVEKLNAMLGLVGVQFARLSSCTLEDISRKAPQIWRIIEESRNRIFNDQVGATIQAGIREGAIRKDIDPKLTVVILLMIVQHILNPEKLFVLSASAKEVFEAVVKITYQGLLSDDARKSFSVGDAVADVVGGTEG
jgi:AcrR family transcriptional regulator